MAATRSRGLRLDVTGLKALIDQNRQEAKARRVKYLRDHPDYIECVVAGCDGLVAPRFVRTTKEGQQYGYCPRRDRHQRIAGEAFAR